MQSEGWPTGIGKKCEAQWDSFTCFFEAAVVHGAAELGPGFMSYCGASAPRTPSEFERWSDEWTSDHEAFLRFAVEPSLDELGASGELDIETVRSLKSSTVATARLLRRGVQSICRSVRQPK